MNMDQNAPQFNFSIVTAPGAPLTMSSREIAEVVDSRHDKVKQSMERLAERGLISFNPVGEKDTGGRPGTIYLVGKRDSYVNRPGFTGG